MTGDKQFMWVMESIAEGNCKYAIDEIKRLLELYKKRTSTFNVLRNIEYSKYTLGAILSLIARLQKENNQLKEKKE